MKRFVGKKIKLRHKVLLGIYLFSIIVYSLAWFLKPAVDFYRLSVFPLWTNTLARVMSLFPFSVGEILIYVGIFFVFVAMIFLFLSIWKKQVFWNKAKKYYEFLLWVIAWVILTETMNCFVLYHASTVEEQYYENKTYGVEELCLVYGEVVEKANELSLVMERDAAGNVVYDGDLYAACKTAMQNLGTTYPYLSGYYPNPKPIASSDFMSQQYLTGIYFPFTLEANYNTTMYLVNAPATICHEFSHLKGIILEDEANYFGFVACIQSKDAFLQYSGYLSVIDYLEREVKKYDAMDASLPQINTFVRKDSVFLTEEAWDKVEKKAVISTETANKATDKFLQSNLKANGVSDGMISYSRVVRLLLDYYDGILWED
ncbi:MAG: DUF3810 domain-containing protein [Lachnospiraceae bacterium]|nr:DUF3810 domain-containing protein [Lachnospiraceae bacterium]